jgi:hypothetical protein
MRNWRAWGGAALAIGALSGSAAQADIHVVSQLRQTAASVSITTIDEMLSDYDSATADNFDPIDQSSGVTLTAELSTASGLGFAKQVSSYLPQELDVFASADSNVSTQSGDDQVYSGATSRFSVRFTTDEPARYLLTAAGFAQNSATSVVRLREMTQDVVLASFEPVDQESFSLEIKLPAGDYSFFVDASANGYVEPGGGLPDGRSEMVANLVQVPEPASFSLLALAGLAVAARAYRKR